MSVLGSIFSASTTSISDLKNPQFWLSTAFAGAQTTSGEPVDPTRAMFDGAYFACIRLISEDVGKLPRELLRTLPNGDKEKATDDPLWPLIHDRPNDEMTNITFYQTLTSWALGWGRGPAEIQRDGRGDPVGMWPIHPSRVKLRRDADSGKLFFQVNTGTPTTNQPSQRNGSLDPDKAVAIPLTNMVNLHGLGPTEFGGYALGSQAAETIGVGLAAEKFGGAFFGNNATLGTVLEHPETLSPEARENLQTSIERTHSGSEQAFRTFILEEGMKLSSVKPGVAPKDSQMVQIMQHVVTSLARWFRVPPHKIQDLTRSSFSNIETQAREYVDDTLMPWLIRWEQELRWKLLGNEPSLSVKHVVQSLLRGDSKARADFYNRLFNIGALSPNDVRRFEDLPSVGDDGDGYFLQQNLAPLDSVARGETRSLGGGANAPTEAKAKGPDIQAALEDLRPVFEDAARRVCAKEAKALERATAKHDEDPEAFREWAADFYRGQATYALDCFRAPFEAATAAIGSAVHMELARSWPDVERACHDWQARAMDAAITGFTHDAVFSYPLDSRTMDLAETMHSLTLQTLTESY
jgi:HK97 family phage portal protein